MCSEIKLACLNQKLLAVNKLDLISNHFRYAINTIRRSPIRKKATKAAEVRKLKIEIVESVETLSKLLKPEKNPQKKERIQALYWIKTNLAETIGHLSALSGKHRTTGSRWLSSYRKGGFSTMVDIYNFSGRKPKITPEIQQILINEFNSGEPAGLVEPIRARKLF